MKISIIIPIYKTPRDLFVACIESVLAWENDSLEVILVIDSPGHEIEKDVYAYEVRDARVKVLRNEINKGPAYSRNRGIEVATGDYLMMVDADDKIIPSVCETALRSCFENDLAYCAVARVFPWQKDGVNCFQARQLYIGSTSNCDNLDKVLRRLDMSSSGVWYKRDFLIRHDFRYPEDIRQCEDFTFTTSIVASGAKVGCWDEYGYVIVPHQNSLSRIGVDSEYFREPLSAAMKLLKLHRWPRLSNEVQIFYAERIWNAILKRWDRVPFKSKDDKDSLTKSVSFAMHYFRESFGPILTFFASIGIWLIESLPKILLIRVPILHFYFRAIRKFNLFYRSI